MLISENKQTRDSLMNGYNFIHIPWNKVNAFTSVQSLSRVRLFGTS